LDSEGLEAGSSKDGAESLAVDGDGRVSAEIGVGGKGIVLVAFVALELVVNQGMTAARWEMR